MFAVDYSSVLDEKPTEPNQLVDKKTPTNWFPIL